LLNLSFAVRVSEPVTLIFVPPVEMPAPWHVRLGETTLKLAKALRYVELDYLCHMSSEVLHCSDNMRKAHNMPKWRLTE
jgi:hypothetical protein